MDREFVVEITEIVVHEYTVEGRTAEEATAVALGMLEDGDEGEITETSIEETNAVSSNDYAQAEEDDTIE